MTNSIIGVVGATGKTGIRVAKKLTGLGYSVRPLSRQSELSFDWNDRENWRQCLEGLDSVYITYHPDLAIPRAESDIEHFVSVAKQAGVKHLVLLSGRGEEGAQKAEKQVMQSGLRWNIVRASWFMQNFSESFMLDGILARNLVLPEPKALEPFIDVDDIADVAVAALTREDLGNQLLEITGPELLSFSHCVITISEAVDSPIEFHTIPVNAYIDAAKSEGMPDDIAWLMNELFSSVLDGRNEWKTNTIETVLGRPAKRFSEYVQTTAATGVWEV